MNDSKKLRRFLAVEERIQKIRRKSLAEATTFREKAELEAFKAESEHERVASELTRAGTANADDLALRSEHVRMAHAKVRLAESVVVERKIAEDERRNDVVRVGQRVKMLETARDRAEAERDRELRKREQDALDEAAGRPRGGRK